MTTIALLLLTFSASVRDFGAKGDGVADDTAAFQRAIAAGKKVVVPPGTYRVGQVVIGAKTPGRWLCGAGRDVTILQDTGAGSELVDRSRYCVAIIDAADVRVSGITIRGRGNDDADTIGVAIHAAPRVVVDGCAVESIRGRGIWVQHAATKNGSLRNCLVRNIRARADGLYGVGVWYYGGDGFGAPSGCAVYRLTVDGCDADGLLLDAGTSAGPGAAVAVGVNGLTLLNCATGRAGGAAALGLCGAQGASFASVWIDWPASVATGPAIAMNPDQTGVKTSGNKFAGVTIQNAWDRAIVAAESDGTNTVANATIQSRGGSVSTITRGAY